MDSLRSLGPDQQVGLLFVVLFGLLALASVGALLASLRDRGADQTERQQRLARDLRALWIGASVFWLAWISGAPGATTLFGIVSFLSLREYLTLLKTRRGDHRSLVLAFFFVLPMQYLLLDWRQFDLASVFIPVYVFLAIPVLAALAGDPQRFLERNAEIQWGIMVCVYGLSQAPALLLLDWPGRPGRGAFLLLFLVVVTAVAQIAQEAASRRLRRRPLARHIDRSFSLRALGVGVAASALAGVALFWITPFAPVQALLMAALAGAAGNLGEFVMRALKKDAGIRAWGNTASVTGAVGLLDRVAPLCFAAPVFIHAVRWLFGTMR